jgi:DNA-binding CsgD family transcriptional regulator/PAS domain-containing protein
MDSSIQSELLEILYAAPLDAAKWQEFLDRLCAVTGSITALYINNNSEQGVRRLAAGGLQATEEIDQTYEASYRYTDPIRLAFLRNPRVGYIEGEDLITHEDLVKTDLYQTVAAPHGLAHFSLIVTSISPRRSEVISVWRAAGRRILEPQHRQLMEALLPHMQNVLNIRRALGLLEDRVRTAEAMLDANANATILLNDAGCLVYMNQAAQQLALDSDGFSIRDNRPVPTNPSRRAEFAALVAACTNQDSPSSGGALTLERRPNKRPLQLVITPLRLADPHRRGVRALIMATDPDKTVIFPDDILRQLYGLTPAETEVANGLLTGFSVEEIAQIRKVSITTLRSQMSSLLSKTGAKRQSDLIRLLAMLPQSTPSPTHLQTENPKSTFQSAPLKTKATAIAVASL